MLCSNIEGKSNNGRRYNIFDTSFCALAVGQVKDAGAVGGVGAGVVRVRSGRAGRAAHAAPHRQRRRRRPAVASLRTRRLRLRTPCLKEHAAYAIKRT